MTTNSIPPNPSMPANILNILAGFFSARCSPGETKHSKSNPIGVMCSDEQPPRNVGIETRCRLNRSLSPCDVPEPSVEEFPARSVIDGKKKKTRSNDSNKLSATQCQEEKRKRGEEAGIRLSESGLRTRIRHGTEWPNMNRGVRQGQPCPCRLEATGKQSSRWISQQQTYDCVWMMGGWGEAGQTRAAAPAL